MNATSLFLIVCLAVAAYGKPPSSYVVGGRDAPAGQYPYQVSLRKGGIHFCGGSIINKRYILTAAHCLATLIFKRVTIHAGTNHLNEHGDVYHSEKIIPHRGFSFIRRFNDIGLIRVNTDIVFNDRVQPIELDSSDSDRVGDACVLTGWGLTGRSGMPPNNLQEVDLRVVPKADCSKAHGNIDETQICTFTKRGEGACNGDSGGPLVSGNVQIGVVSFGDPCAVGTPDVFTRVSAFRKWIEENQRH